jgi:hypothetical protein
MHLAPQTARDTTDSSLGLGSRRAVKVLALAAAILAGGCGPSRPPTAQVTGRVTLDGRPLARGSLCFEAPGMRPATARIEDGRIVAATTHTEGDGLPVGRLAVAVFAREERVADPASNPGQAAFAADSMTGRSLLPRRYNDPATSGLMVTINPGENTLELALESQPP